jgi:hypothetical protein
VTTDLPYKNLSRQQEGRLSEKKAAKNRGARLHPNSGAGHIKHDFSDDETLYEHKDAGKGYRLTAKEMNELHIRAYRQGKQGLFIIKFENGTEVECRISRMP